MTLIAADNFFLMGALLFSLAWLGFWIDGHPLGKKTSGVLWVICIAMLLSNVQIISFKAPIYDFIGGSLVPLAIPLLLFKADLFKIFRESGPVMVTFCIASLATVVGAVLGFYLFDLGAIGAKVAGTYTGGWIGGAVNFLAVSKAVGMTEGEFSVAISASSLVSIIALMSLIAIPSIQFIVRRIPSSLSATVAATSEEAELDSSPKSTIKLTHLSGALALSFCICAVSDILASALSMQQYSILFITLLAILVANLVPNLLSQLQGDFEIGMLLMYLFFAAVGAGTNATSFIGSAAVLFFFGLFIIAVHLALVLTAAKVFKIDLAEAIIASGAALVGPAPTAAIAISRGWRNLVTPGIMCGIFGYVIATFIGVTVTKLLG